MFGYTWIKEQLLEDIEQDLMFLRAQAHYQGGRVNQFELELKKLKQENKELKKYKEQVKRIARVVCERKE